MEFQLSEEEKLLQWAVNDFAQKELNEEELRASNHVPQKIVARMGGLGFLGLKIPERYGGEEGTWVEVGILCEEMAKRSVAIAHLIMRCYEITSILAGYARETVKDEWLAGVARGDKIGCIAVTEPGSGMDLAGIKTNVLRSGDSHFITGEKNPVSFGMQADFAIVFGRTSPQSGTKGISAFLAPLGLPGIRREGIGNMGLQGSAIASIVFDQVKIPLEYEIGEQGKGLDIHLSAGISSSLSQILLGTISVGASEDALNRAVSYSRKRYAFGRPVAGFQAISAKIAEDLTLVEAARLMCYRALWLRERALPHAKESAMCKWWCTKVACDVIRNSLLIHGHTGYCDDLPLERMLRDMVAFRIMGGADQLMKLVIAYKAIGRSAIPDDLAAYMRD